MNTKYQRYIEYIVNDLEIPYFINMRDSYGLSPDEYELVLSKVFNQPVTIKGGYVNDIKGNRIYSENSVGYWIKYEYDEQGNMIYIEDNTGYWSKYEYDGQGNEIYWEDSDGGWYKKEFDNQGNRIYYERSDGYIEDNR